MGSGGVIDRLERVMSSSAPRRRLIVIDDIQFLTGDRLDWVAHLLAAARTTAVDATLLVTSRDAELGAVALVDQHHRLTPWNRATIAKVSPDGTICIHNHTTTDLLTDIVGYIPTP